jgi:cyclophilin family peptidyl-prolyl cis-trans isomerase
MGKAQKLKEIRKQERQEAEINKKEKRKSLSTAIIAILVIAAVFIGWRYMFSSNNQNTDIDTQTAQEKIAVLETNYGVIKFKMYSDLSPKTVENFEKLSSEGFYNGVKFHRVIKDFMIQTGDPNSKDDDWSDDGMGGPGYKFDDEINSQLLVRGSVAMANSGPNTNGSQFFIVTATSTPWLDGLHTNFGEVIEGYDVVEKIENVETNENDHPLEDVIIEKAYLQ